MKKTTYECKKCGKACNGGGVSFIITEAKDTISIVLGNDMDQLPEHACGEEHMVQVFAAAVRKIKGGGDGIQIATARQLAEEVEP